MTSVTPSRKLLVPLLGVLLVVVVGLALRTELRRVWMEWRAQSPLDEGSERALERCEDPGWPALVAVLLQDLDVSCPDGFLATAGAGHLRGGRVRWIREQAEDPSAAPRLRLRAATWLMAAGEPAPRGLAVVSMDEQIDIPTRRSWTAALAMDEVVADWAEPQLRDRIRLIRVQDGAFELGLWLVDALRREAVAGRLDRAEHRRELVEAALLVVGLEDGALVDAVDRSARGLPLHGMPVSLARAVAAQGQRCDDLAAPACAAAVSGWLETVLQEEADGFDGGPEGAEPEVLAMPWRTEIDALLEVLYGAAPGGEQSAARWVAETVGWLEQARTPAERAGRLVALVAHPHPGGPVRADPLAVMLQHHGPPWTTAAVASTLGELADVYVEAAAYETGVALKIGHYRVAIGACGERLPPPEALPEPWPDRSLVAAAALEASREVSGPRAAGLRWLAGRLDPVLAEVPFEELEFAQDAAERAGQLLGSQLRVPGEALRLTMAIEARRELVERWPPADCGQALSSE